MTSFRLPGLFHSCGAETFSQPRFWDFKANHSSPHLTEPRHSLNLPLEQNYPSATPTSSNNRAWEIPKENIIKDNQQKLSQQSTLTVVGTGPADEETYTWVFDVILRLSEALVCFRASRANFLRSITRAIVNKKEGKRKIDFLTSFWNFQKLSFVFAPPGITFCALSPGLY